MEAIRETMEQSGDTDTNCCIVGGMFGAINGYIELRKLKTEDGVEYFKTVIESDHSQGRQKKRGQYHTSTFIETLPRIIEKAPKKIKKVNGVDISKISLQDKYQPPSPMKRQAIHLCNCYCRYLYV